MARTAPAVAGTLDRLASVKAAFTAQGQTQEGSMMGRKRTAEAVENAEYAAMVRRMVRAYGRRLADSDPSDLPEALALMAELDAAIGDAVRKMRATGGFSWAEIAAYTGATRQAAYQRWGKAPAGQEGSKQ